MPRVTNADPGGLSMETVPSGSVARAVAQFAVSGLIAVAVLGFIAVKLLEKTGRDEAIRDAEQVAQLAGEGVIRPALTPGILTGDADAIARLDAVVHDSLLRNDLIRVKLWDADGRILYSDEHRLIGSRYDLGEEEIEALHGSLTDAEISDLGEPENRFERPQGKLLEVYHGIEGPRETPMLFEVYLRYSSIAASGERLWQRFAPALIITLILLELAQVPLAYSLARRVRRGQEDRVRLLRQAIAASELERGRIAADLHDGAVQNLAGVSYSLSAAAGDLQGGDRDSAVAAIEEAARETRRSIRDLRTLLVDIYPADLHRTGLAAALGDLVSRAGTQGVEAKVDVDEHLRLPADAEALLYRGAQEAVRNALAHAGASHLALSVVAENGVARLEVRDDGRGFDPGAGGPAGPFGLRVLADLAENARGSLDVTSSPGAGTTVRLEVPTT
jgi:two-component system, NarL family, sensor kinase